MTTTIHAEENGIAPDRLEIGTRYLGPGRVLQVCPLGHRVRVRLTDTPDGSEVWARIGLSEVAPLRSGDQVLILGEGIDNLYVIGRLSPSPDLAGPGRIALPNGAYAQAAGLPERRTLQVFSPRQELLLEYDAATGKTRVNLESGNLEFVTRQGDIAFHSGQNIRFQGQAIEMQGQQIKLVARRLETLAETILTHARNVYKAVEELTQLRTGRLRALIRATCHLKSKNAYLNAAEDFKVNADNIHLG